MNYKKVLLFVFAFSSGAIVFKTDCSHMSVCNPGAPYGFIERMTKIQDDLEDLRQYFSDQLGYVRAVLLDDAIALMQEVSELACTGTGSYWEWGDAAHGNAIEDYDVRFEGAIGNLDEASRQLKEQFRRVLAIRDLRSETMDQKQLVINTP